MIEVTDVDNRLIESLFTIDSEVHGCRCSMLEAVALMEVDRGRDERKDLASLYILLDRARYL